jgi:hypothetical protein
MLRIGRRAARRRLRPLPQSSAPRPGRQDRPEDRRQSPPPGQPLPSPTRRSGCCFAYPNSVPHTSSISASLNRASSNHLSTVAQSSQNCRLSVTSTSMSAAHSLANPDSLGASTRIASCLKALQIEDVHRGRVLRMDHVAVQQHKPRALQRLGQGCPPLGVPMAVSQDKVEGIGNIDASLLSLGLRTSLHAL